MLLHNIQSKATECEFESEWVANQKWIIFVRFIISCSQHISTHLIHTNPVVCWWAVWQVFGFQKHFIVSEHREYYTYTRTQFN